jgi:hypothetical protein
MWNRGSTVFAIGIMDLLIANVANLAKTYEVPGPSV